MTFTKEPSAVGFAKGVRSLSLEDILELRLTDQCLSMYYADGSQRKLTRSTLLEHLNIKTVTIPTDYSSIVDIRLLWRLATPTTENSETVRGNGRFCRW